MRHFVIITLFAMQCLAPVNALHYGPDPGGQCKEELEDIEEEESILP